ncbi:hypothetical protein [Burkholderia phage BCSR5]|nr:hypothetical protein [Burkholderia phage BCSR5]
MTQPTESKPIKVLRLSAHNVLARMFHLHGNTYQIIVTRGDEFGPVSRTQNITGESVRHAKTRFQEWTATHYPEVPHNPPPAPRIPPRPVAPPMPVPVRPPQFFDVPIEMPEHKRGRAERRDSHRREHSRKEARWN